MKEFNVARVGMIAGWITLAGILVFSVIGPSIIAGQRVSGTFDVAAIKAFYSHRELALFHLFGFVTILAMVPYIAALRKVLKITERSNFWSLAGFAFAIASIALYAADNSLEVSLVGIVQNGGEVVPLFRLWDVLYNSGSYITEAGYVACFGLAMRDVASFPRWMQAMGIIVALLQIINASAIHVGIPDQFTIVGNLALISWFIGANIGLGRMGSGA
jgi:hypothetical protein